MIEYRHLTELKHFERLIDIQREVWGFDEIDAIPLRLFLVASKGLV